MLFQEGTNIRVYDLLRKEYEISLLKSLVFLEQ